METTAALTLSDRIIVPEHVLASEVGEELAILNIDNETYFGLDDVGARMWQAIREADDLAGAVDALAELYEVPRARLEGDLLQLVAQLRAAGLVQQAG